MMNTKTTTVIDYIVQRLADEGIKDCFGVPGDYAFPVCDAVDRSPNIKWIGCSNELNASYAADRYAHVHALVEKLRAESERRYLSDRSCRSSQPHHLAVESGPLLQAT